MPLRMLFLPNRRWQLCFLLLFFKQCSDVRLEQDTVGAVLLKAILPNGATPSIDKIEIAGEQVTHGPLFVILGKCISPVQAQSIGGPDPSNEMPLSEPPVQLVTDPRRQMSKMQRRDDIAESCWVFTLKTWRFHLEDVVFQLIPVAIATR